MAQQLMCLTSNRSVIRSGSTKCSRCFHEQETLPSLLSTDWFQERVGACLA